MGNANPKEVAMQLEIRSAVQAKKATKFEHSIAALTAECREKLQANKREEARQLAEQVLWKRGRAAELRRLADVYAKLATRYERFVALESTLELLMQLDKKIHALKDIDVKEINDGIKKAELDVNGALAETSTETQESIEEFLSRLAAPAPVAEQQADGERQTRVDDERRQQLHRRLVAIRK